MLDLILALGTHSALTEILLQQWWAVGNTLSTLTLRKKRTQFFLAELQQPVMVATTYQSVSIFSQILWYTIMQRIYLSGAQKRAVASEKKRKEDNIVKKTPKLTAFLPE